MCSLQCNVRHYVCVLVGGDIDTNNIFFQLRGDLRQMIDTDFQLLETLVRRDVLTEEERLKVKRKETYQERNDVLLNCVIQKKGASLVVLQFINCLQETDQDHVCNFICCNGGKQTFFFL